MRTILVVDDKEPMVLLLKRPLEQNGYEVYTANRGREALEQMEQHRIDLVLLDLKLPDISGFQVCKELRAKYPSLPIIIISAVSDERGKVQSLLTCADDYVSKPVSIPEVLARIKVQFLHADRMRAGSEKTSIVAGPVSMHLGQRRVEVNGQEIDLTYKEFELLHILMKNRGRIITYDLLLSEVWGDEEQAEWKNVHVYINRLRKKIEILAQRRLIYNEPKVGYRFQVED